MLEGVAELIWGHEGRARGPHTESGGPFQSPMIDCRVGEVVRGDRAIDLDLAGLYRQTVVAAFQIESASIDFDSGFRPADGALREIPLGGSGNESNRGSEDSTGFAMSKIQNDEGWIRTSAQCGESKEKKHRRYRSRASKPFHEEPHEAVRMLFRVGGPSERRLWAHCSTFSDSGASHIP